MNDPNPLHPYEKRDWVIDTILVIVAGCALWGMIDLIYRAHTWLFA